MILSAQDILNGASEMMNNRANEYDSEGGERSMEKTVAIFNLRTGFNLKESDGWIFMEILKDVRQDSCPGFHLDSALDGVAYSALKNEALSKEKSNG